MFLVNVLTAAGKAFADWRRQQRAYTDLMALDDHALADIGIHRSQIRAVLAADRKAAGSASSSAPRQSQVIGRRQAA